jgi:23S rRNA pseudouridine1911/1915/1917 synthase
MPAVPPTPPFTTTDADAGQTLAAVLRHRLAAGGPPMSWGDVRQLIAARRVQVNGTPCVDDARRLRAGESVAVLTTSLRPPPAAGDLVVRFLDDHLVVVEKPAGVLSVRNPEEAGWDERRKGRQPTLDELLQKRLPRPRSKAVAADWRVRPVHRLDRDTSGLTIYALSAAAEQKLIALFAKHQIDRAYRAVVHGNLAAATTYESHLVRDRGDGLRGSAQRGADDPDAQRAVTHVKPVEHLGDRYTAVDCRLETGRTHQIRIHLSEAGHPLCGDPTYRGGTPKWRSPRRLLIEDHSGAPRQALHAQRLALVHPITGKPLTFDSAWPDDLAKWWAGLRR